MLGIRVQFAGTIRRLKRRFNNPFPQILLDRVARHARPTRDLANGHLISQRPFPNNFQKSHVYHPMCPQLIQAWARLHMGQFSMTISAVAGAALSDNQQAISSICSEFSAKPAMSGFLRIKASRLSLPSAIFATTSIGTRGRRVDKDSQIFSTWPRATLGCVANKVSIFLSNKVASIPSYRDIVFPTAEGVRGEIKNVR